MVVQWNAFAAPALVALAVSLATSALVYFTRPYARANRRLGLLILLEGVVIFCLNGGAYLLESSAAVWVFMGFGTIAVSLKPAAYLSFLATLPTTLTRWFRSRTGMVVVWVGAAASASLWFVAPHLFVARVTADVGYAALDAEPGLALRPLALLLAVCYVVGLTFAFSAVRQAPTPIAKRRARFYRAAFGTREVLFVLWAIAFLITPFGHPLWPYVYVSVAFVPIVYIPLVVYGILQSQMFDIDIKLKFAFKQGTIASILVAVFFVASETIEQLLPVSGLAAGIGAAAAVALLLWPVRSYAQRMVDAFLPGVGPRPEYLDFRKTEVYRAAIESLGEDGVLTDRERGMLARLRQELGVDEGLATQIERETMRIFATGSPGQRPDAG